MHQGLTLKELKKKTKSELINSVLSLIQSLTDANGFIDSLKKIIDEQNGNIQETAASLLEIKRQLGLCNRALFASTSEKSRKKETKKVVADQNKVEEGENSQEGTTGQDNIGESGTNSVQVSTDVEKPQNRYKNGHPGRAPLPDHLPRVVNHHYP